MGVLCKAERTLSLKGRGFKPRRNVLAKPSAALVAAAAGAEALEF